MAGAAGVMKGGKNGSRLGFADSKGKSAVWSRASWLACWPRDAGAMKVIVGDADPGVPADVVGVGNVGKGFAAATDAGGAACEILIVFAGAVALVTIGADAWAAAGAVGVAERSGGVAFA